MRCTSQDSQGTETTSNCRCSAANLEALKKLYYGEFIRIVADYYFNRSNAKNQKVQSGSYIFNVQL